MSQQFALIIADLSRLETKIEELIRAEELEIQRLRSNSIFISKVTTALDKKNLSSEDIVSFVDTKAGVGSSKSDAVAEDSVSVNEKADEALPSSKLDEILQLAQRTRQLRSSQSFPSSNVSERGSHVDASVDASTKVVRSSISSKASVQSKDSRVSKSKHDNGNSDHRSSSSTARLPIPVPKQLKLTSAGNSQPRPPKPDRTQPLSSFVDLALQDLKHQQQQLHQQQQQQQQPIEDPVLVQFRELQGMFSHFIFRDKLQPSSSSLQRLHQAQVRLLNKAPVVLSWKNFECQESAHHLVPSFALDANMKRKIRQLPDLIEFMNMVMKDVRTFHQLCESLFASPRLPSHKISAVLLSWMKVRIWQQVVDELFDKATSADKKNVVQSDDLNQLQQQVKNRMETMFVSSLQNHPLGQRLLIIIDTQPSAELSSQFTDVSAEEWRQWCEYLKIAKDAVDKKLKVQIMFRNRVTHNRKYA